MNAETIATVASAVVLLTQIAKWAGLPLKAAPYGVLLFSALGVGLWGYSLGPLGRPDIWNYFVGWITVAAAAAGVYGFTRAGAESLTRVKEPKPPVELAD